MKTIVHITLVIFSLVTFRLHAADKTTNHSYDGKVTGLYCTACAGKVKAALEKLDGVTEVKITRTEEQGIQKIHLESSSGAITKDAAIKALGEDARFYTILSLNVTK